MPVLNQYIMPVLNQYIMPVLNQVHYAGPKPGTVSATSAGCMSGVTVQYRSCDHSTPEANKTKTKIHNTF